MVYMAGTGHSYKPTPEEIAEFETKFRAITASPAVRPPWYRRTLRISGDAILIWMLVLALLGTLGGFGAYVSTLPPAEQEKAMTSFAVGAAAGYLATKR